MNQQPFIPRKIEPPKTSRECCSQHQELKDLLREEAGSWFVVAEYNIEELGVTEATAQMTSEAVRLKQYHLFRGEGFRVKQDSSKWVPGSCVVLARYEEETSV